MTGAVTRRTAILTYTCEENRPTGEAQVSQVQRDPSVIHLKGKLPPV